MVTWGMAPEAPRSSLSATGSSVAREHRITMADIAARAGVSKGAVSRALNDRPGVSVTTRRRILQLAEELGWYPHRAARSLSAARADACGLVIARPARSLAAESYFIEFIAGIEAALSSRSASLMLHVVADIEAEVAVYKRWWAERRVDGVLVVDLRLDDPRVAELERIRLPAVVVGGPEGTGELSAVWVEDDAEMAEVVRYLARLGHRRIARVAGMSGLSYTQVRGAAFARTAAELGLSARALSTDYTRESGASATRRLLTEPSPPTAIIFDNDVLAVAGLGVAQEMGLRVPHDVSLVAWDDSYYCQIVHPALTAMARDVSDHGARAVNALFALLEGGTVTRAPGARGRLTPRASTGPAPERDR